MRTIEEYYNYYYILNSDINEHLPTLKKYAEQSDIVYELGVRGIVSTWALLAGYPKKMVSVDITHPSVFGSRIEDVYEACKEKNIDFSFELGDSTLINIEKTDLLFIDTNHTYSQLNSELKTQGNKASKWIILHDTESCGEDYNINGVLVGGLNRAISEFISSNPHWSIKETYKNCNGLTILERKGI